MVELASIRISESPRGYVFDFVEDDFQERLERYASSAHRFTIDQCARKFQEKNRVRIGKHLRKMADYGILKPVLFEGKRRAGKIIQYQYVKKEDRRLGS